MQVSIWADDPEAFAKRLSLKFASGISAYEDRPSVAAAMSEGCPYPDVLEFSDGEPHALHRRMVRCAFPRRRSGSSSSSSRPGSTRCLTNW